MNINPFLDLIIYVLNLYKFALTIWILLSWLISFNIINRHQSLIQKIGFILNRLVTPVLDYLRKYIPSFGGMDLTPIILFLAIGFIKSCIYTYFYR